MEKIINSKYCLAALTVLILNGAALPVQANDTQVSNHVVEENDPIGEALSTKAVEAAKGTTALEEKVVNKGDLISKKVTKASNSEMQAVWNFGLYGVCERASKSKPNDGINDVVDYAASHYDNSFEVAKILSEYKEKHKVYTDQSYNIAIKLGQKNSCHSIVVSKPNLNIESK